MQGPRTQALPKLTHYEVHTTILEMQLGIRRCVCGGIIGSRTHTP